MNHDLLEISELIRNHFTPFAFTCECGGTHPDCNYVMTENTYAIAQNDTVERICDFIERLAK